MPDYRFSPAQAADLEQIFALYVRRVEWMRAQGIHQWNESAYLDAYPLAYYREQQRSGRLYALTRGDAREILGAVVLLEEDECWEGHAEKAALYIHNLVTHLNAKGAGRIMLSAIEDLARQKDKHHLRLDCDVNNAFLNAYYADHGYEMVGTCSDGPYYEGNLREKAL